MSLASYSDLQGNVATWLGRSDLTDNIADFITLFEAYANRNLRARQMETSTTLQLSSSGVGTLPTDYLDWRRVSWTGSTRVELAYRHPQYIQAAFPDSAEGTPQVFTIEGASLYVRPVDDTDLEFLYYQKIPVLSASNTTNWLLTAHPDAYLFGALTEAAGFVVDLEKEATWKSRRDEVLGEISALGNLSKGGGSPKIFGWVV